MSAQRQLLLAERVHACARAVVRGQLAHVHAELIAEASFGPRSYAARLPGVGWLITTPEPAALIVVDEELAELARFPLPSDWRAQHWVSPDLQYAVLSEEAYVAAIDRRGRTIWTTPHRPWGGSDSESGSCWVSRDGRHVWATVPTEDGPDAWNVLDSRDGRVIGRAALRCYAAGSHPVPHPDGVHIGLSVGEGQDGSELYWGSWKDGPNVARLDSRTRLLADVRPNGRQYLATPHSDGELTVHAFPSGAIVARLQAQAVCGEDDYFDFQAGYVTDDLVLVASVEKQCHLLLSADALERIAVVQYPRDALKESISATGRGAWLTAEYVTGRHQVWRLRATG